MDPRAPGVTSYLYDMTWGGNQFVAVGSGGAILTSPDGVTWTPRASGVTNKTLYGVTWGGNQFVAVGSGGTILTSPDGVSWTPQTSGGTSYYLWDVGWSGTQFVVVGRGSQPSTILTSPDGVTWTRRTSGTSHGLAGVAWNGHRWVAVGGLMLRSDCTTSSGDVNGDSGVNALDVVAVINQFLGLQDWPGADVNGDGAVNALDVVFVINRVLGM